MGINSNRAKSISKFEARKKLNLKNKLIYITYGSHILKAKHKGGHLINSIFQKFVFGIIFLVILVQYIPKYFSSIFKILKYIRI